jgi:hypothetical protein
MIAPNVLEWILERSRMGVPNVLEWCTERSRMGIQTGPGPPPPLSTDFAIIAPHHCELPKKSKMTFSKSETAQEICKQVHLILIDRLSMSVWATRVRTARMDDFMTRSVNRVIVAACNYFVASGKSVDDDLDLDAVCAYARKLADARMDVHFHAAWDEMCADLSAQRQADMMI